MGVARACPAFSMAFAVTYLAAMDFHPALTFFTYAPRLGTWSWGVPDLGRSGPGMYWYSWLLVACAVGLMAAALSLLLPPRLLHKATAPSIWVVPLVLTAILLYIERTWFGFK